MTASGSRRILYVSSSYVPSRRASSVQVMHMCAAFVGLGHSVTLVTKNCPPRQEAGVDDAFAFYGVERSFSILPLDLPARRGGGSEWRARVLILLRRVRHQIDLVFSRDLAGAISAARLGLPVVFEAHHPPSTRVDDLLLRALLRSPNLRQLVVISAALGDALATRYQLPAGLPVTVAHDAASATFYPPVPVRAAGSGQAAGPGQAAGSGQAVRVGYVGNLYVGRGIEVIIKAATRLPELTFDIVGGQPGDLAALRSGQLPANLQLHGFVAPGDLPAVYGPLDVVLLPHQVRAVGATGRTNIAPFCSPLKLFEYMAAGKAIVASNLAVFREVLENGRNALLVEPADVAGWVLALEMLAGDPGLRVRLGQAARADFEAHFTWEARATRIAGVFESFPLDLHPAAGDRSLS